MSTNSKWESPRINSGSELALRAENERLDRLAWDYRGELTQAQEEIERLRDCQENAAALCKQRDEWKQKAEKDRKEKEAILVALVALRRLWEERRAAWNLRHTQIVTRETVPAIIEAALANRIYAITGAIEDLNAILPVENENA